MTWFERFCEWLLPPEIPDFSIRPSGASIESSADRTVVEMILIALWDARLDRSGDKPWEMGSAQLWMKLSDVYRYECSIGILHVKLDLLERKGFLASTWPWPDLELSDRSYRRRIVSLTPAGVLLMLDKQKLADLEAKRAAARAYNDKFFGVPKGG